MTSTTLRAVALATLAAAGCGGGGSSASSATAITCAWFAGSNCWKDSVAAAHACTPNGAYGHFDAPTTHCTYTDGTLVSFDPSAPASTTFAQDGNWDFTVLTSTAATCAHYVETDTGLSLTTRLGTFTESASAVGGTVLFTCPDGSRYSMPAMDMLSCPWSDLPGRYDGGGAGSISFGLLPAPPGDTTFWSCLP